MFPACVHFHSAVKEEAALVGRRLFLMVELGERFYEQPMLRPHESQT